MNTFVQIRAGFDETPASIYTLEAWAGKFRIGNFNFKDVLSCLLDEDKVE